MVVLVPELPLELQSSWLLLGVVFPGFPSKWTGWQASPICSQARMMCLVSLRMFLIPHRPSLTSIRTVTKENLSLLIHRLRDRVLPPALVHTFSTCCFSLARKNDCVGLLHILIFLRKVSQALLSHVFGTSSGIWRLRKTLWALLYFAGKQGLELGSAEWLWGKTKATSSKRAIILKTCCEEREKADVPQKYSALQTQSWGPLSKSSKNSMLYGLNHGTAGVCGMHVVLFLKPSHSRYVNRQDDIGWYLPKCWAADLRVVSMFVKLFF